MLRTTSLIPVDLVTASGRSGSSFSRVAAYYQLRACPAGCRKRIPDAMSIYVEIRIRGDMDELWRRTQDPGLHERWDLRFSEIVYPSPAGRDGAAAVSATPPASGSGLRIRGDGESEGSRVGTSGEGVSALRSGLETRSRSSSGSGYWRYVPTPDGIRFLTWYSYRTRFGLPGRPLGRRGLLAHRAAGRPPGASIWLRFADRAGHRSRGLGPAAVIHAVARLCTRLSSPTTAWFPSSCTRTRPSWRYAPRRRPSRLGGGPGAPRHRPRQGRS